MAWCRVPGPQPWVCGGLLVLVGTMVAGCGACDPYTPVNLPAPPLALETLDGQRVELSSFLGRPVVLHFWLPSCRVCLREMPDWLTAARSAKQGATVILAVSLDPDVDNIKATATRLGLDMPVLVARGEVLGPMHVASTPSTVFIDKTGVIRAAVNGPRGAAFHQRRFKELDTL